MADLPVRQEIYGADMRKMDRIGEPHSTHDLMLALSTLPVPVLPLLLLGIVSLF